MPALREVHPKPKVWCFHVKGRAVHVQEGVLLRDESDDYLCILIMLVIMLE